MEYPKRTWYWCIRRQCPAGSSWGEQVRGMWSSICLSYPRFLMSVFLYGLPGHPPG